MVIFWSPPPAPALAGVLGLLLVPLVLSGWSLREAWAAGGGEARRSWGWVIWWAFAIGATPAMTVALHRVLAQWHPALLLLHGIASALALVTGGAMLLGTRRWWPGAPGLLCSVAALAALALHLL